jgi:hypothetical protein
MLPIRGFMACLPCDPRQHIQGRHHAPTSVTDSSTTGRLCIPSKASAAVAWATVIAGEKVSKDGVMLSRTFLREAPRIPPGGIGKRNALFTPPLPPPACASGHCWHAALAAPPAHCGDLPPPRTARRGTAMRRLDRRLRMGDGSASGVSSCQGLGTARMGRLGGWRACWGNGKTM